MNYESTVNCVLYASVFSIYAFKLNLVS